MWQAIQSNRRRSLWLLAGMGVLLTSLGAAGGAYIASHFAPPPDASGTGGGEAGLIHGALIGAGAAFVLWLVMWLVSVYRGDRILLRSAGARKVTKADFPRLLNIVEEMKIASGLSHMPEVYVVDDDAPNAFAVGRKPETASVAVTSGLLRLANRDELQGVVAHETAHVKNLDIRFMTIAAVSVASVELLSHFVLRTAIFGSAGRRRGGGRSGANPLAIVALVFAILSPILVRLLYLACSRQREYLADASAARFTRYPEGLASALEKIAVHHQGAAGKPSGSLAALYIVNPLQAFSEAGLWSTHPPAGTRIKVLRAMGGGAGYVDYAAALEKIERGKVRLAALEQARMQEERIAARGPSPPEDRQNDAAARARETMDLLDRFANFILIPCACGLRIKTPPEYDRGTVICPRCERVNAVPHAHRPETEAGGEKAPQEEQPGPASVRDQGGALEYDRRGEDWESFKCACGQVIQLGPNFPLDYTVCARCERRIELKKSQPAGAAEQA